MSRLRFSLSTLLIAVTVIAIGMFLWTRLAVPNITGVSLSGGDVVLHLGDDVARKILPDNPYLNSLADDPNVSFHDAYVKVPIWIVAVALSLVFGLVVAGRLIWIRIARRIWCPTKAG